MFLLPEKERIYLGKAGHKIPIKLLKGLNEIDVSLTPEESFILSRIDEPITIDELILMTGMDEAKVFNILEKFARLGIIENKGFFSEDCDLSEEEKKFIDGFWSSLNKKNYFQILGIEKNASMDEIKDAGMELIRKFHPDSFFRRKLGEYEKKLEDILEKIKEAMEVLSNEEARKVYTLEFVKTTTDQEKVKSQYEYVKEKSQKTEKKQGTKKKKEQPLDKKKLQSIKEKVEKAKKLYEECLELEKKGKIKDALLNLQLCIAYDPFSEEYIKKIKELKSLEAKNTDWQTLYKSAVSLMTEGEFKKAALELKRCLEFNPTSSEPYRDLIGILAENGQYEKASDVGELAVEKFPDDIELRLALASVYEKSKNYNKTIAHLKKIIRILIKKR